MSECKICRDHGYPGIMIAWDNNVKSKTGRFVPLEQDKVTPHKHYESTKSVPESNDYPNPITATKTDPKLDLNNLSIIKVIAAALQEYIAIKEVNSN